MSIRAPARNLGCSRRDARGYGALSYGTSGKNINSYTLNPSKTSVTQLSRLPVGGKLTLTGSP